MEEASNTKHSSFWGIMVIAGTVIGAAVASAVTTIALSLYKNVFGAGREVLGQAKGSAHLITPCPSARGRRRGSARSAGRLGNCASPLPR